MRQSENWPDLDVDLTVSVATTWRGKPYNVKQVEVYAIQEGSDWLVLTVLTRYF